ncbi:glycosyltransferase family 4 protein [Siphonobacter sp. BAB-5385]|uniref:glycosyltransferase family 4 protein n=1 Tax=Siphonobacter sp. BAB-5385 TaxID=1864822 RepID=UPI001595ACA8|nr:glycosyltransferase family 4 protein [Siphonobacter sp. BAB-5385]
METALLSGIDSIASEFDLLVICLGKIEDSVTARLTENAKNTIISYELNTKHIFKSLGNILAVVNKTKPQYIITSLWKSHYIAIFLKILRINFKHIPFIHSTRSFHILDSLSRYLIRFTYEIVWTDSRATTESLLFVSRKRIISFIREKLEPKPGFLVVENLVYRFLFIGRITSVKRLDLIFKFIKSIYDLGINIRLDVYGPDYENIWQEYQGNLHEMNISEHVNYCGSIAPDLVKNLYYNYDCYIQLSEWEGMSLSVIEAMMSGLVCFVTPVGEIKYYSKDKYSAIHLLGPSQNDWDDFVNKSLEVLQSQEQFKLIAHNASENWGYTMTYADSFIEAVYELDNI